MHVLERRVKSRRRWAWTVLLASALAQPACLTATQWEPRLSNLTIAAIGVAEVGVAAGFATAHDSDPHSDWNQTSYGLRAAEMFAAFAAVDLIVFGLCHADLTHTK